MTVKDSFPAILIVTSFLVACGVLAGFLLAPAPLPASVSSPASEGTIPVVLDDYFDEQKVELGVILSPASPLVFGGGGVVTAITCSAGTSWSSGDVVVALNAVNTPLLAASTAPWRDLARGDEGADVIGIQTELARLGYPVDASGYYDWDTGQAVKQFMKDRGGLIDTDLPRSAYIWMSAQTITVSSCPLARGMEVGSGTKLADIAPLPSEISVVSPKVTLVPGARSLRVGSTTIDMPEDSRVVDVASLMAVASTPEFRAYLSGDGKVPLVGYLALKEPISVANLPPSAIVVDRSGTTCSYSAGVAHAVTVLGSDLGRSIVAFVNQPPEEVSVSTGETECG